MLATSARAWARRTSASGIGPAWVRNRFSAPMIESRSRSGKAYTDVNPAPTA